jgi:lipid A 3-O-deacylase
LNHTRLDDRNLGIHFAFQDRFGIGAFLGASDNISLGVHAVHYSNAHLSIHNSGITIPLVLDIGYRFS